MDKLILDMTKEGMSINDVMEMPFEFLLSIMEEKNKPEQVNSVMDLP